MKKWVEGKLNKAFLYFLSYLFDDFSKWSVIKLLQKFDKSSNMPKNGIFFVAKNKDKPLTHFWLIPTIRGRIFYMSEGPSDASLH